mmetsp:Transcript_63035/g.195162  ORF Transcript_63035/g.195162 Transcript_63035/m.195162 type:complete len:413 (-) Transcript_63035:343-1581(-)
MAKLFAAFGSSPLLRSIRGLLSNQPVVPRLLRASMSLDVAATGRDGGPACKELIARWSVYHPTPLARRDLAVACLDQQARLEYGTFLHQELRIRFARRVRFFQQLPYGLPLYPGIRGLTQRHTSYVTDLEDCETPRTAAQDRDFTSLLRHIIAQQSYFEEDLFTSFREFALGRGSSYAEVQPSIDAILQRVVAANIGTKVLMSHHVSSSAARPGAVGVVQLQCDPAEVAQLVARQCHRLCRGELGEAPEIDVRAEGGTQLVALVPGYVHYMLTEVLKNACRAVVERHFGCPLPPVVVDIELGSSMVTFHIRDEGGGMSPSALQSAWKFMHTTCKALRDGGGLGTSGGAMAGFGVGLPTARLFARHFGGDLQLSSQEGVGTEARIIVNTCGGCRLGPLAGMGLQVPTGEGTDR